MKRVNTLIFCLVGNALEWYDFAIFAMLAPIISQKFFPQYSENRSLLITFSIFATGFLMRPLGGIVFGHIGDKYGRRKAIIISVFIMAIATTSIGLLPTHYHSVYPVMLMLLFLRLLQGFAVSGEYAGIVTFVSELVVEKNFFFYQGMVMFSVICGMIAGTFAGKIAILLHHHYAVTYAWRLPFLASIVLGTVGGYLRLQAVESPLFIQMKEQRALLPKLPIAQAFSRFYKLILLSIAFLAIDSVGFYYTTTYFPVYVRTVTKHSWGLGLQMITLLILLAFIPIVCYFVNKKNAMQFVKLGVIGFIILPFISAWVLQNHYTAFVLPIQIGYIISLVLFFPLMLSIVSLQFPISCRYTCVAMCINVTVSLFGGSTPVIMSEFKNLGFNQYVPALFISAIAIISLLILYFAKNQLQLQNNQIT